MRAFKATMVLLALILACQANVSLAEEDNPLLEFFPYGVYLDGNNPDGTVDDIKDVDAVRQAVERACKDVAAHHMNAVWPNNLMPQHLPAWLKLGQKYGLRVVPQSGGPPTFIAARFYKDKQDLVRQVSTAYEQLTKRHSHDAALLAWSIGEESKPLLWVYEGAAEITHSMQRWDATHPAIMLDNNLASAELNARIVGPKAMAMDCYPFFCDPKSGPVTPSDIQSYSTRQCAGMRAAADSIDAPFWMMGQAMAITHLRGAEPPRPIWRWPTPAELRWQLWTAVQQGTRGFFSFIYHGTKRPAGSSGESIEGLLDHNLKETPQYRMAAKLGQQLETLAPILLKLEVAPADRQLHYQVNAAISLQTHIHRETGERFLSVVNNDWNRLQKLELAPASSATSLKDGEKFFDLRSGKAYDDTSDLLPGDGTIYFVGSVADWQAFSSSSP